MAPDGVAPRWRKRPTVRHDKQGGQDEERSAAGRAVRAPFFCPGVRSSRARISTRQQSLVASSLVSSVYVRLRSGVFALMRWRRSRTSTVFDERLSQLLKIGSRRFNPASGQITMEMRPRTW